MSERIFNIHDVILIVIVLECLLLALFQSVQTQGRKNSKLYLGGFLSVMSISYACVLVLWNEAITLSPVISDYLLPYLLVTSLCARGPFLYLYTRSITTANYEFNRRRSLHFIIVPIALAYTMLFSVTSTDMRMQGDQASKDLANYLWDSIKYLSLGYTAATLYQIHLYRKGLKESYSIFSTTEINWLTLLTGGIFVCWGWGTLVHVVGQYTDISRSSANAMGLAANYMAFLLINTLFIYSLVFAHRLLPAQAKPEKEEKKKKPVVEEAPDKEAIEAVRVAVQEQKIYLEQNINIEQFATQIDLPVKTVSLVINRHFGTNFFEFINSNRVEAAKKMLADPDCAQMTILEILLASGFNSTSSFHRQFKRFAQVSPTEYRQKAKAALEKEKASEE